MLKFLIFLTVIALGCGARIPRSPAEIETVKAESENGADGAYNFMYEGSDGSFREEKAVPVNVGEEDEYLAITGSYRYISAEGKEVEVHYTADTRGFIITGQTIHDSSGTRQTKSIQTPAESSIKTSSENPTKSLNKISSTSPPKVTNKSSNEVISESPSQTSTETPSKPTSESPSQASTETPSKPTSESPSPVSTETPSKPTSESPSQASSETPSEN